jgi:hypothetical protein
MKLVVRCLLGLGMLFGALNLGAYLGDTRGVVGLMLLAAYALFLASESKRLLFHQLSLRFVSLISSILGWLSGLPLLFIDYQGLIGGTAGVGVIGPLLLGLLSATLCLLGLILGITALTRTRGGERRGRGMAWTGIGLSWLALTAYVVVSGRIFFGFW